MNEKKMGLPNRCIDHFLLIGHHPEQLICHHSQGKGGNSWQRINCVHHKIIRWNLYCIEPKYYEHAKLTPLFLWLKYCT
jgi:hypothetical protein